MEKKLRLQRFFSRTVVKSKDMLLEIAAIRALREMICIPHGEAFNGELLLYNFRQRDNPRYTLGFLMKLIEKDFHADYACFLIIYYLPAFWSMKGERGKVNSRTLFKIYSMLVSKLEGRYPVTETYAAAMLEDHFVYNYERDPSIKKFLTMFSKEEQDEKVAKFTQQALGAGECLVSIRSMLKKLKAHHALGEIGLRDYTGEAKKLGYELEAALAPPKDDLTGPMLVLWHPRIYGTKLFVFPFNPYTEMLIRLEKGDGTKVNYHYAQWEEATNLFLKGA